MMSEQALRNSRRAGWSDAESDMLWETADEAHKAGLPLKAVFESIAEKTGRRPNSIRNYYYAEVRRKSGDSNVTARFVPFTEDEVEWLIRQVLIARSEGMSVRACLQKLSGGDHSLTLRYQNKYRAILKSRPDFVKKIVDELNKEGVKCTQPEVNHRMRVSAEEAEKKLTESAYRSGDSEIVRACETLTALIDTVRSGEKFTSPALVSSVLQLVKPVKNFVSLSESEQKKEVGAFSGEVRPLIGKIEEQLPAGSV